MKSMLSMVILGSVVIGIFEAMRSWGIPVNESVVDIEKTGQELLKGLPHIGLVIGYFFDTHGVIGSADFAQYALIAEVIYGLLLFVAFKLMNGITALCDKLFLMLEGDSGFIPALAKYVTMMFMVFLSVMLSKILLVPIEMGISKVGIEIATGIFVGAVVVLVWLAVWIGGKRGFIGSVVDTLCELFVGFLTVALIYVVVLCAQIMSMNPDVLSLQDVILVLSGEILGILGLTIIGAGTVSKVLSGVFPI